MIESFLSEGCTVLVPTFTETFHLVPPPPHLQPLRNGWDYSAPFEGKPVPYPYSPASPDIDSAMGAVPRAVVEDPRRVRSVSPLDSFSAIGALANELTAPQTATNVYAPLRELAARGGFALLMGVTFRSLTLIHAAEQQAGRRPFVRWAMDSEGTVVPVDMGSCSAGFCQLEGVLRPVIREAQVGASHWLALPAANALALAAKAIVRSPSITRCDDPSCMRCADAIAGGPRVSQPTPQSGGVV